MSEHNIPKIQISIRLEQNGQVVVHGPLHDKILCLGLIELGKDAVLKYDAKKSNIVVPNFIPPQIKRN